MAAMGVHDAPPAGQRAVRGPGRGPLFSGLGPSAPGAGAVVGARGCRALDTVQGAANPTAAFELLQAVVQPPWARDPDVNPARKVPGGEVQPMAARRVTSSGNGTPTGQRRSRNSRGEQEGAYAAAAPAEGRRSRESAAVVQQGCIRGLGAPLTPPGLARAQQVRPRQQQELAALQPPGPERVGAVPWSAQPQPQLAAGARPPNAQRKGSKPNACRNPVLTPSNRASCGQIAAICRVASEPNSAFRAHMEDSSVVIDPFLAGDCEGDFWGYFAVYDGHGGRQAVDYCEAKLHGVIYDELRAAVGSAAGGAVTDDAVSDAVSRSFHRVDDQLRLVGAWRCGCTATVVLAHKTSAGLRLHVANVGDSRCIAIDGHHSEWRLSRDHRPNDPAEIQRVESEGGFVSRGRVSGQLGVSRALGDHSLKGAGVTWRPSVCARDASHDIALIIGSDGLWDAMGDADVRAVVDRTMTEHAHDKAADILVREAWRAGSTDNITCLVAFLGRSIASHAGRPRTGGA